VKTNKKKYIFIKEHMINKYSIYMLLFLLLIMLINFSIVLYYIFKSKKKEKFAAGTVETAMDFHNIIQKINPGKLSEFINDEKNYDDPPASTEEKTYIITYITAPTAEQLACPAQQEPEVFPPILFIRQDQGTTPPVLPTDYGDYDFTQDFVLGKYPQNDADWVIKYNAAKAATINPNPIVINIPVINGIDGNPATPPVCQQGPKGDPGQSSTAACLPGIQGPQGSQGQPGEPGPPGNDCICQPGLPGPRGLDGIPGQPGICPGPGSTQPCTPGNPGNPGVAGDPGVNGKNCKFIHELDSYLPKHIHDDGTGPVSAPYIKMDTGANISTNIISNIPTSEYNLIYFDLVSKTFTDTVVNSADNNYIVFITNK